MSRPCSICAQPLRQQVAASPSGKAVEVYFCNQCDRRHCQPCGNYEADPRATKCSKCSRVF